MDLKVVHTKLSREGRYFRDREVRSSLEAHQYCECGDNEIDPQPEIKASVEDGHNLSLDLPTRLYSFYREDHCRSIFSLVEIIDWLFRQERALVTGNTGSGDAVTYPSDALGQKAPIARCIFCGFDLKKCCTIRIVHVTGAETKPSQLT